MSNVANIVAPSDLGKGFDINTTEKKINIKPDGSNLVIDENGALNINPAVLAGVSRAYYNVDFVMGDGSADLTLRNMKGQSKTVDLSDLAKDINLTGASNWDAETLILTLKQDEGGEDVTIDLNSLAKSTLEDSDTVTLTGNGTVLNPIVAQVNVGNVVDGDTLTTNSEGKAALDRSVVFDTTFTNAFGDVIIGYGSSTNS